MGSVVTSLKKLYKKLGGDKAKGVNTIDGMVNKIAEKVNGGGGSSATPDWNVNDSSAPGYIDNRPFYEFDDEINVLDPMEITFNEQGIPGVVYKQYSSNYPLFKNVERINPGDYLAVTVDGVKHELIVIQGSSGVTCYVGGVNPGDSKILTNKVGITFDNIPALAPYVRITGFYLAGEGGGTHTISVTYKKKSIVTIPNKYLEPTKLIVNLSQSTGVDTPITSSHTRSEIIGALNYGKTVMLYHAGSQCFYSLVRADMAAGKYSDNATLHFFNIYEEDKMVNWEQITFLSNDTISKTNGHFS